METEHVLGSARNGPRLVLDDYLPQDKSPRTRCCSRLMYLITSICLATDIEALITANPEEIYLTSAQQWTALHMICVCIDSINAKRLIKVARMLIQAGIDINAQDNTGHTALMRLVGVLAMYPTAIDTIIELFNILISLCDVNLKNRDGFTALHLYYLKGGRDDRVVQSILDAEFNLESKTKEGDTVLMILMKQCWRSVSYQTKQHVRALIAKGANIDAQDREGNTALHAVATDHGDDPVRFLLECKANPNIRNNRGQTPIMICHPRVIEHREVIYLLHKAGATDSPQSYRICSIM